MLKCHLYSGQSPLFAYTCIERAVSHDEVMEERAGSRVYPADYAECGSLTGAATGGRNPSWHDHSLPGTNTILWVHILLDIPMCTCTCMWILMCMYAGWSTVVDFVSLTDDAVARSSRCDSGTGSVLDPDFVNQPWYHHEPGHPDNHILKILKR